MLGSLINRLFRKALSRDWLEEAASMQRAGRYSEAMALCEARLAQDDRDVDALEALAAALLAQGRTAEGIACLAEAAALAPADARVRQTLGQVHASVGQFDAAIASYGQALALKPDLGGAADAIVALLKAAGRYDEAEDRCRQAIAVVGDGARRRYALAGTLFEQGRVEEAIAEFRASLALEPDAPLVETELVRALNYVADPDTVFEAHRAWGARHAQPLTEAAPPHSNNPDPDRRLRVGYASPYLRKHAVTFFLEPAIAHRDRDAFDVVLYADVPRPDEYSERLKSHGARWRSIVGASDAAVADIIRADGIDILVDLSGQTPGHRLLAFARRPAPVQATWMGYPNTTGMTAVDYRIADARCDPPGMTERLHTERLVRLPEIYLSWQPPSDAPDPGPLPALQSGRITFGSFNGCYKISETAVRLWSRILLAIPGSRLLLFAVPSGRAEDLLRHRFAAHGVVEGLEFRPRVTLEAFMESHREVDIALDSYPYHGTTTTCSSLWMGVPVVSHTGSAHVSRVGTTMLASVGLPHLAADTPDGYVAAACELAGDLDALARLRAGLRGRMASSPLTDGPAYARALDDAYRRMWRTWCSGRS